MVVVAGRGGVRGEGREGIEASPLRPAHELSRAWEIPERTFYAREVVKLLIGVNIALVQCIACSLVIFFKFRLFSNYEMWLHPERMIVCCIGM